MNILKANVSKGFASPEVNLSDLESARYAVSDRKFVDYITSVSNGGFYFNNSLHLYGFCKEPGFHNVVDVNEVFLREYTATIAQDKFLFGQDVFGNQFAFGKGGIFGINGETGDSEFLARDFSDWLELLSEDTQYLTGVDYCEMWKSSGQVLPHNYRLCAKMPFVVGGAFAVENFYAQKYPDYLASNANVARQIFGKPDGTKVEFKIVD